MSNENPRDFDIHHYPLNLDDEGRVKKDANLFYMLQWFNNKGIEKGEYLGRASGTPIQTEKELLFETYDFVIPDVTKWECTRCGECCKCVNFNFDHSLNECPMLNTDSLCKDYSNRPRGCKEFPFHIIELFGTDLLMISTICNGHGKGKKISLKKYDDKIRYMNKLYRQPNSRVEQGIIYLANDEKWIFATPENKKKYGVTETSKDFNDHFHDLLMSQGKSGQEVLNKMED